MAFISESIPNSDCLIVGGGICGLITATILQRQGLSVIILDKGRGIGGRLASRRLRDGDQVGCFDYGAQYFTVTQPSFQAWVEEWLRAGVITPWADAFALTSGGVRDSGKVAYRGTASNRSLAQYLADDLPVLTQTRVTKFDWGDHLWQVMTEDQRLFTAKHLVLTPPVPQSLELLKLSPIELPGVMESHLTAIAYAPCLSLLVLLENPSLIPSPGGLWGDGDPLAWLACNHQKGISPQGYAVTLHGIPGFSQEYFEADDATITAHLLQAADPWLGSSVMATSLHRWRYSLAQSFYPQPFAFLDTPGPLYLGGDAFVSAKVEGAVLSGQAIAAKILAGQ